MEERKRFIPYWLRRCEEPLQKDVLLILDRCNAIRRLTNTNGDGDVADLEGARVDLRDALEEIFNKGVADDNPLWAAVMMIRPQVINGRLPVSMTEDITSALWDLKNDEISTRAEFFGRLASRLRRHQVNFYRAVIAGEPLTAKEKNGEWKFHYFPGIPLAVRREAGVRLSTAPENVEAVLKAYKLMAGRTAGHAKTAIEAVIADIEVLSEHLYLKKKI